MQITLAGVRGTTPTADAVHARFGGETTCVLIQDAAGAALALDAGTGLRLAAAAVERASPERRLTLCFSHYHLDHVEGLPRLPLLYRKDWAVTLAAPPLDGRSAEQTLPRLFEPPFWPLPLSRLPAEVRFEALAAEPDAGRAVGGLVCRWCAVQHPGGCYAYRVDEPASGRAVVFATDLEWAASSPAQQRAFERLCAEPRPADLLIWDGQFTPQNYDAHRGWGHSRWSDGVEAARRTGAGQLLITHHAPGLDDRALRTVERAVREALPGAALARQGLTVRLGPLSGS